LRGTVNRNRQRTCARGSRPSAFALAAGLAACATPVAAASIFLVNANAGVNAREDALYGYDASTDGAYVAIAEPGGLSTSAPTVIGGAVEIWRRQGAGVVRAQRIVAPQPASNGAFGMAVRLSGDWLAVSSQVPPVVSVYRRNGALWLNSQTIEIETPGPGRMPWLVELDGDWLVFATFASGVLEIPLQAYRRTGDDWVVDQPVTGLDTLPGDNFGAAGAIARGSDGALRLAVGAPGRNASRGAAYVFVQDAGGWQQEQRLQLAGAQIDDGLGFAIAMNGDSLIAGAAGFDASAQVDDSGRAAIWRREGSGDFPWQLSAVLALAEPHANDRFGRSVALPIPRLALVGAPGRDIANPPFADYVDAGSALRYVLDPTPLACSPGWVADGGTGPPSLPQTDARHGWVVAGGSLLAAGAIGANVNAIPGAGRVSLSLDDRVFRYGHDCPD
jgi:hypothetical protein